MKLVKQYIDYYFDTNEFDYENNASIEYIEIIHLTVLNKMFTDFEFCIKKIGCNLTPIMTKKRNGGFELFNEGLTGIEYFDQVNALRYVTGLLFDVELESEFEECIGVNDDEELIVDYIELEDEFFDISNKLTNTTITKNEIESYILLCRLRDE